MAVFLNIFGFMVAAPVAFAQSTPKQAACGGIDAITGKTGSCDPGNSGLDATIRNVIGIFSVVIGVAAVIVVLFGGFRYITAAGDTTKVNTAKNTILYAMVGLVIASLAQIIVRFVLKQSSA